MALFAVFFQDEDGPDLGEDRTESSEKRRKSQKALFLRLFGPIIRQLGKVIATLPMDKRREKLRIKLQQAGYPGGLNADEL